VETHRLMAKSVWMDWFLTLDRNLKTMKGVYVRKCTSLNLTVSLLCSRGFTWLNLWGTGCLVEPLFKRATYLQWTLWMRMETCWKYMT